MESNGNAYRFEVLRQFCIDCVRTVPGQDSAISELRPAREAGAPSRSPPVPPCAPAMPPPLDVLPWMLSVSHRACPSPSHRRTRTPLSTRLP